METNDVSILPDRAEYLCKWPFVKRARATILAAAPTQPSLFDIALLPGRNSRFWELFRK